MLVAGDVDWAKHSIISWVLNGPVLLLIRLYAKSFTCLSDHWLIDCTTDPILVDISDANKAS